MQIKADLMSVDFNENTITFAVDEDFFKKVEVMYSDDASTIESENFILKK